MNEDIGLGLAIAGIAIGMGLIFGGGTRQDLWRIENGMKALADAHVQATCIEAGGNYSMSHNLCEVDHE